MTATQLRDKLGEEIRGIPDSRLQEVFDLIHFFRLGLEREASQGRPDIMSFAGAWEDMEGLDELEAELRGRRSAAFKSRRQDESGAD
jgi:hypothetical protein